MLKSWLVKIRNKDNACAFTLKCIIAIKFPLNFEFSSHAEASNFLSVVFWPGPKVKKPAFAQHCSIGT